MEKDCERRPDSAGECRDQLAMSAAGEGEAVAEHPSHAHVFPEVSPIAFYGTLSQM